MSEPLALDELMALADTSDEEECKEDDAMESDDEDEDSMQAQVDVQADPMSITSFRTTFAAALPGEIKDYKFGPELLRATNKKSTTAKSKPRSAPKSKGKSIPTHLDMKDAVYAANLAYIMWTETRQFNDGWPGDLTKAIEAMKPIEATKPDVSKKKRRKWWSKRDRTGMGFEKLPDGTPYLTRNGLPVLSESMVTPVVSAVHDAYGHRSSTALMKLCQTKFHAKVPSLKEACDRLGCDHCNNEKPLPKPAHTHAIRTYFKGAQWQMDHTEIASAKLQKIIDLRGDHGFRYLLNVLDLHTKHVWVFPCKTVTEEEVIMHLTTLVDKGVIPDVMQSDNGKAFKGKSIQKFWADRGTRYVYGGVRTPEHQVQPTPRDM
jgi:transposase InsO family protein